MARAAPYDGLQPNIAAMANAISRARTASPAVPATTLATKPSIGRALLARPPLGRADRLRRIHAPARRLAGPGRRRGRRFQKRMADAIGPIAVTSIRTLVV